MTATAGLVVGESVVYLPRFQTKRGERAIDLKQIVYLSALSNYTIFHLNTGEEVMTTLSLSSYALLLETRGFIRVHKSNLLNGHYLGKCRLVRSGELMLPNGKVIEVARRRRSSLKKIAKEKGKE
ncbi:LytTR family transcriptional regulator [Runella rosea]|uniref:LytTR family transcriptional regulator n=1 Tax=Runella rosea TaxID=2259595 RepID=A0A344TPJ5_9BACT|nr:LytTR family transcriptional regulator DNA-binding domain-containing protein [Runella rosea]AXE20566.1 LytTR family transcriptional regulator [Runella rosea]